MAATNNTWRGKRRGRQEMVGFPQGPFPSAPGFFWGKKSLRRSALSGPVSSACQNGSRVVDPTDLHQFCTWLSLSPPQAKEIDHLETGALGSPRPLKQLIPEGPSPAPVLTPLQGRTLTWQLESLVRPRIS